MVFAVKMILEARDRRPWIVLFIALLLMFILRCLRLCLSRETFEHLSAPNSFLLSLLLFIAMFYIRKITIAERESENRYRSLVELSPDAIFVDAGDRIVYINPAGVRFFGATGTAQLLGQSPLDLLSKESADRVRTRIAALSDGAPILPVVEEEWIRLDGSPVTVEAVPALIPWQGVRPSR